MALITILAVVISLFITAVFFNLKEDLKRDRHSASEASVCKDCNCKRKE
jgi:hypothetical protein